MINNQETNIICIDTNIKSDQNILYREELINLGYKNINCFNKVNESITCIKGIFFETTKIIINGNLFTDFVNMFKNGIKSIYVIPKIIIFTEKKENFIETNKNEENLKDPFYDFGGIVTSFEEIKSFLSNNIESKKFILNEEPQLTFEYIDRDEKLALQYFN